MRRRNRPLHLSECPKVPRRPTGAGKRPDTLLCGLAAGKPRHADFFTDFFRPAVGDARDGTDLTVGGERRRLPQETG